MTNKKNTYEMITEEVIAAMEAATGNFELPWNKSACSGLPVNGSTKKEYKGINIVMLWISAASNGFTSNEWFTFKQAKDLKGQVRKGEKGTRVVFWKFLEKETEESSENEDSKTNKSTVPVCRYFTVFNRDQIDGLPEVETSEITEVERNMNIEMFIRGTGARIVEGPINASYNPAQDFVKIPSIHLFTSPEAYYSTLFHELGHWTGHSTRLDRDLSGRFGDTSYAMEELIAEMTSAFLCAEFQTPNFLQHGEYLANWIQVLKDDKYAIFTAAREATKAAQFLKESTETEETCQSLEG